MGNLGVRIKRFLGNKNTVTIIGVIVGVAVLLGGYNYRVSQAVKPQSIPYAINRMEPKSKVEMDNIGTIKVSGAFIEQSEDLITNKAFFMNKDLYVSYDTVIPAGSLLYEAQFKEKKEIPDTAFDQIEKDSTIFSLSVDSHSTYGNSIMPDNYIDLYLKTTDETGKVIFGKFIESIKVLSVRDSSGNDVFSDSEANRTTGELLFAVKDDLFLLLSEASFVEGIDIVPVPRNAAYRIEGENSGTNVSKKELADFILAKVSELSDNSATDYTPIMEDNSDDASQNDTTQTE